MSEGINYSGCSFWIISVTYKLRDKERYIYRYFRLGNVKSRGIVYDDRL
jgi:hypothetical protein